MKIKLLFLSIFLTAFFGFCQTKSEFQKINQLNGLSSNHITCITKEENGFVWIGTNNGLNRYDGFETKVYNIENSNITSNLISDILIDTKKEYGYQH